MTSDYESCGPLQSGVGVSPSPCPNYSSLRTLTRPNCWTARAKTGDEILAPTSARLETFAKQICQAMVSSV